MRLIPSIDLLAGRCVRLLHGDFDTETRYSSNPEELVAKYRGLGADWIHVVDLDGARDGNAGNRAIIQRLAAQNTVHLQVGGGLRNRAAVAETLALGVARAVVGSAAVAQVDAVREWLVEFGAERIALAFDVRLDQAGVPRVATHGWREQSQVSLWSAVDSFSQQGLVHVLCTDVRRDGALTGPNVDLYREAVGRYPNIEWQASGGVRDLRDLAALADAEVAAAISGKALLDELIPAEELQAFLPNA
ncbi:MAG: 1-(5-phosphoribosyl)-5-[(5-phosphoribosylamino)methylideneamino]imidazole-4-carboxamide isomerase [Steroidobacteraceae bacterium]|jgi:phosphoribosylformimino-5-aminoimidazole carboxamide ribotide isomerase